MSFRIGNNFPIDSVLTIVGLRTNKMKNCESWAATVAMAFKLTEAKAVKMQTFKLIPMYSSCSYSYFSLTIFRRSLNASPVSITFNSGLFSLPTLPVFRSALVSLSFAYVSFLCSMRSVFWCRSRILTTFIIISGNTSRFIKSAGS